MVVFRKVGIPKCFCKLVFGVVVLHLEFDEVISFKSVPEEGAEYAPYPPVVELLGQTLAMREPLIRGYVLCIAGDFIFEDLNALVKVDVILLSFPLVE